jgi:4-amino-4-deoxy-L-arabinose transferase-like glycosyltransferase
MDGPQEAARERRWLIWLLIGHVVVWTLVPVLTQPNLPLDAIEMLFWGREWELGYHKHPPLAAWMAETAACLTANAPWALYLLPQLAVVATLWSVWRLGREFVAPKAALLSVLLLECCLYFNLTAVEFNNNVATLPFWSLAVLFFYWAVTTGKHRHWVAAGACIGLALLAKYSAVVLGAAMFAFLVLQPDARRWWRLPGPYLMALAVLAVFGPHLGWAWRNDFPTLHYAAQRTASGGGIVRHFTEPLGFAAAQLAVIAPLCVALAPLAGLRPRLRPIEPEERFRRDFLLAVALGPIVVCLVLSLVFGMKLRSMHGSHMLPHVGLLLVFLLQLRPEPRPWRHAVQWCGAIAAILVVVAVGRNVAAPFLQHKGSRIHFPGQELADVVDRLWRDRYGRELPIVGGESWLAGNVSFYSPDRPTVYAGRNSDEPLVAPQYAAWTSDEDLLRRGGVLLWNAKDSPNLPQGLRERFPTAEPLAPLGLRWQTRAEVPPLAVGVAIVAPGSKTSVARGTSVDRR